MNQNQGEIILYQPDSSTRMEVLMHEETVWLNLIQMSQLFGRDKSVISRHIRNIFQERELHREATVAKFATVQIEDGRQVLRQTTTTLTSSSLSGIVSKAFVERSFDNGQTPCSKTISCADTLLTNGLKD
jgi:hypothetical protein